MQWISIWYLSPDLSAPTPGVLLHFYLHGIYVGVCLCPKHIMHWSWKVPRAAVGLHIYVGFTRNTMFPCWQSHVWSEWHVTVGVMFAASVPDNRTNTAPVYNTQYSSLFTWRAHLPLYLLPFSPAKSTTSDVTKKVREDRHLERNCFGWSYIPLEVSSSICLVTIETITHLVIIHSNIKACIQKELFHHWQLIRCHSFGNCLKAKPVNHQYFLRHISWFLRFIQRFSWQRFIMLEFSIRKHEHLYIG